MNITRTGALAVFTLAGSLALSACGSDPAPAGSTGSPSGQSSSAGSTSCFTGTLNAEGSSAQKNAFEQVAAGYGTDCPGATVNYNPTGSGTGIKQFLAGQTDFAGSDSALKTVVKDGKVEADEAAATCGSPAWNIPMVVGPIAIAYNVKGIDTLVLTPAVAADIFNGTITTWNAAPIAALNPGVALPATPVKVFFRSDESGTTENFTKYLKAAAPAHWPADPAKKWTGKGEGKEKSAGVSEGVKSTDGGVTYVEWSYAKDNNLGVAQIDNGAGPVELTGESVGKAVLAAKADGQGNDLRLKLDYATKAPGAYPIALVTYEIVCSKGKDAAKQADIRSFLSYFASPAQQSKLADIGYAPLPAELQAKVAAAVAAIG